MRRLYTVLFRLLLPLILLRLYWRGRRAPLYRQRWRERLGWYGTGTEPVDVWLHAVSVGEFEAALPLIRLLQQRYPQIRLLLTTTTPTGSERVRLVLGNRVSHVYLPYDLPEIIERFLQRFQPQLAIFMEKEIWPNLFAALGQRAIPLYVINARLSSRSARAYQRIPALIKPALAQIRLIATQTVADQQQFLTIGATPGQLAVLGNIKFDVSMPAQLLEQGHYLRRQWGNRFVWIIASTHQGEESLLLEHFRALKQQITHMLVVIAPRHPERFATVREGCQQMGLQVVTRSSGMAVTDACDVYLVDSIGDLKMLYAAADIAFVGGSLVEVGGHNVLEPAAAEVPVVFGPWMFNFQLIADEMLAHQAAIACKDAQAVIEAVRMLHVDAKRRRQLIDNALTFLAANQGAVERIAELLAPVLSKID